MLWTFPTRGIVADYKIKSMVITKHHMERGDVHLIFDSYTGNSTKQMMRSSRSGNDASREHQLSLQTTLPTQKVTLNVVHNKVQLIELICHYLINNNEDNQTKLVITQYPTLVKVWANSAITMTVTRSLLVLIQSWSIIVGRPTTM